MFRVRFIPALAGNRAPAKTPTRRAPVHPRARGEQGGGARSAAPSDGSSPRSWGTVSRSGNSQQHGRFIPALAGNSQIRGFPERQGAVHPRARGEQPDFRQEIVRPVGSSPRSRGTARTGREHRRKSRFIPALAGNSSSACVRMTGIAVHPRARGEQEIAAMKRVVNGGSSPRSRGTAVSVTSVVAWLRFIPALAGNRTTARRCSRVRTVHPRARGEQAPPPDRA